ncbi:MAG: translational GTPase TypA [Planctomycetota bacterium]
MRDIRNVAIIAHVDHGKTTLVDRMLQQSGVFRANQPQIDRVLDSNDLERERGITILAKNTAIQLGGTKINIIDTPGHADFGGEVERVLSMADGCLLLVDAFEGPMPQTRFVLRKALERLLRPLVVINKIDRSDARPAEVLDEVLELFLDLDADDALLDFPVIYASAKEGYARRAPEDTNRDLVPLFQAILDYLPAPAADLAGAFRFQVSTIDYNDYVGRIAIGRISRGVARSGAPVVVLRADGSVQPARIGHVLVFGGLERLRVEQAGAGDIVALEGIGEVDVGDTLADPEVPEPLPRVTVDEPTLSMVFRVNDSPFAGREGTYLTSRRLRERLFRECRSNVALRVEETPEADAFAVSGRGTLHLGILTENMRREGYEFAVGKPKVILRYEDQEELEPIELLVMDLPVASSGRVIELLGPRRGVMRRMDTKRGRMLVEFEIPARGLIGLRSRVLTVAGGEAIMHHNFLHYGPYRGPIPGRSNGVLVSMEDGMATAYALDALADRGSFFVRPGDGVYEGMIVGEHCKPGDIIVNVCREKRLTNIRAAGADKKIQLTPPRVLALEEALEFIEEDELVEVTPRAVRLRKRLLTLKERKRAS